VEVWKIGTVTAPVTGSGSWPAWMQRVPNPAVVFSLIPAPPKTTGAGRSPPPC